MYINPNGIFSPPLRDKLWNETGSANSKPQENQHHQKGSKQKNSTESFDFLHDDIFFENHLNSNNLYSDKDKPQEKLQLKNVSHIVSSFDESNFLDDFLSSNNLYSDKDKSQENQQLKNESYLKSSFDELNFLDDFQSSNNPYSDKDKPEENQQLKNVSYPENLSEALYLSEDDIFSENYFFTSNSDNNEILSIENNSNKKNISSDSDQTISNNYINTTSFHKRVNDDLNESSNTKKPKIFENSLKKNAINSTFSKNKNLSRKTTEIFKKTVAKPRTTRNSNKTALSNTENLSEKSIPILKAAPIKKPVAKPKTTRKSNKINLPNAKNLPKKSTAISKSPIQNHEEIENIEECTTNDNSLDPGKISEIINNKELDQHAVVFALFEILSPYSRHSSEVARRIHPYVKQREGFQKITVDQLQTLCSRNKKIRENVKKNKKIHLYKILSIFKKRRGENKILEGVTKECRAICSELNPWLLKRGEKALTENYVVKLVQDKDILIEIKETFEFSNDEYHEEIVEIFNKNDKPQKNIASETNILTDVNEFREIKSQKKNHRIHLI